MPRAVTAALAVLTLACMSARGAPDDAKKTAEAKKAMEEAEAQAQAESESAPAEGEDKKE